MVRGGSSTILLFCLFRFDLLYGLGRLPLLVLGVGGRWTFEFGVRDLHVRGLFHCALVITYLHCWGGSEAYLT